MFRIISLIFASLASWAMFGSLAFAQGHVHHSRHNMVLFGEAEVFASHIVYKVPHNYQVVLRLDLPAPQLASYRAERAAHPADLILFLLDPADIGAIETATEISGRFVRVDANGARLEFGVAFTLERGAFSVLYFNELPLSLAAEPD